MVVTAEAHPGTGGTIGHVTILFTDPSANYSLAEQGTRIANTDKYVASFPTTDIALDPGQQALISINATVVDTDMANASSSCNPLVGKAKITVVQDPNQPQPVKLNGDGSEPRSTGVHSIATTLNPAASRRPETAGTQ